MTVPALNPSREKRTRGAHLPNTPLANSPAVKEPTSSHIHYSLKFSGINRQETSVAWLASTRGTVYH